MRPPDWLTREQIDQVLEHISAADLIEAVGDGTRSGSKVAGLAFDSAAARLELSNGSPATEHVQAADFVYMATQLGEAINVDSPLSEKTSGLLDSAEPGD